MQKYLKNGDFKWGLIILSLYLFWAIFWLINITIVKGSFFRPYIPPVNLKMELIFPFKEGFIWGTDVHGRSLFETISMGLIYTISMGLIISFISAIIGTLVGNLSVSGPSFLKGIFEGLTNIIFIFPSMLIAIIIMSFFGSSIMGLMVALISTGWAGYSRIARGEIKRVLGLPYIEAARALGMGPVRLFLTQVFPGILPQLLIHIVLGISGVILSEAALGFLGLGGSPYSWGGQMSIGKNVLLEAPYISIFLGLTMSGLIIALNLLGDGLRDILDPQSK